MRRMRVAERRRLALGNTAARTHGDIPKQGRFSRADTGNSESPGLRERKKARLRQQIIDTSIRLFRKYGYENTRVEDIVQILEISQPTFFRYFPSKDAVLREVGRRGFTCIKEHLETELSSNATTAERLRAARALQDRVRARQWQTMRPACAHPSRMAPAAFRPANPFAAPA